MNFTLFRKILCLVPKCESPLFDQLWKENSRSAWISPFFTKFCIWFRNARVPFSTKYGRPIADPREFHLFHKILYLVPKCESPLFDQIWKANSRSAWIPPFSQNSFTEVHFLRIRTILSRKAVFFEYVLFFYGRRFPLNTYYSFTERRFLRIRTILSRKAVFSVTSTVWSFWVSGYFLLPNGSSMLPMVLGVWTHDFHLSR